MTLIVLIMPDDPRDALDTAVEGGADLDPHAAAEFLPGQIARFNAGRAA